MILEGIVTTVNTDGELNIAPMGPHVATEMNSFELKPFETSTTYVNLLDAREGVLHITDDVLLFAQAAIGRQIDVPTVRSEVVDGFVIRDACRAYEFKVDFVDLVRPRATLKCRTVAEHRFRDFFGFNRGKHAVIEGAILATRIAFLPRDEIASQFEHLAKLVEKTGGDQEKTAFKMLQQYVNCYEVA